MQQASFFNDWMEQVVWNVALAHNISRTAETIFGTFSFPSSSLILSSPSPFVSVGDKKEMTGSLSLVVYTVMTRRDSPSTFPIYCAPHTRVVSKRDRKNTHTHILSFSSPLAPTSQSSLFGFLSFQGGWNVIQISHITTFTRQSYQSYSDKVFFPFHWIVTYKKR